MVRFFSYRINNDHFISYTEKNDLISFIYKSDNKTY